MEYIQFIILRELSDSLVFALAPVLAILFFIFGLDDLIVDALAWARGARPKELDSNQLEKMLSLRERPTAILVAAWKESGILTKMIQGNLAGIQYGKYSFFIGVYPNDFETRREAEQIASMYRNVHVVVNSLNGPTSKGQMLNEIVRAVLKSETDSGIRHETFLIQDSEDIIHRYALKLINWQLEHNDFVQIPVFSLPVPALNFVAGTYLDEFSEAHTKDVLVRASLKLPIPSAGVGTALSRRLVLKYLEMQNFNLLNERTVTEDYELGVTTGKFGFCSQFACFYIKTPESKRNLDFIATREYFPKSFLNSIKQKTRWTLGIAFQGTENLGWKGNLLQRYFLYRDRKGPLSNFISALGLAFFAYAAIRSYQSSDFFYSLSMNGALNALFAINMVLLSNRLFHRILSVIRVYDTPTAIGVPIRLIFSNIINAAASIRATIQFATLKILKTPPVWAKTEHELPAQFGATLQIEAQDLNIEKAG